MKYWIIGLVTLLIGSNVFWIHTLLDAAISCTYSDSSFDMIEQKYNQSLALSNLNLVGLTVEEAKEKIDKDIHGFEPFEKEGCLYVGQICLQVSKNKTIEVIREPYP